MYKAPGGTGGGSMTTGSGTGFASPGSYTSGNITGSPDNSIQEIGQAGGGGLLSLPLTESTAHSTAEVEAGRPPQLLTRFGLAPLRRGLRRGAT